MDILHSSQLVGKTDFGQESHECVSQTHQTVSLSVLHQRQSVRQSMSLSDSISISPFIGQSLSEGAGETVFSQAVCSCFIHSLRQSVTATASQPLCLSASTHCICRPVVVSVS